MPNSCRVRKSRPAAKTRSPCRLLPRLSAPRNKRTTDRRRSATEVHSPSARPTRTSMYFASDNTAGIAAPILDAIGRANTGYALGYGNDDWTKRVERRFAEMFERDVAVFLVPTGTAANALALTNLRPP